jgi:hypothetical protein
LIANSKRLNITTYAVGVWGRLAAPEDLLVSPVQGDFVALHERNRTILGGFATLQTSPQEATVELVSIEAL